MSPSVNRSSEPSQPPENLQEAEKSKTVSSKSTKSKKSQVTPEEETPPVAENPVEPTVENPPDSESSRERPIPPASEPMQYRAIGLISGKYMPSAEQLTQGTLLADDFTLIDAVLLGRVMSLVKNHLNLAESHMWVVYPRTRKEDNKLHVQIMGVWSPKALDGDKSSDKSAESSEASDRPSEEQETPSVNDDNPSEEQENPSVNDGYFSIRGEVVYQDREAKQLVVKVRQSPRKPTERLKFFKLKLEGFFDQKMVGNFWEFHLQRQGDALVVQEGKEIGPVKTRSKKFSKGKGKGQGNKKPPASESQGEAPKNPAPATEKQAVQKPKKPKLSTN